MTDFEGTPIPFTSTPALIIRPQHPAEVKPENGPQWYEVHAVNTSNPSHSILMFERDFVNIERHLLADLKERQFMSIATKEDFWRTIKTFAEAKLANLRLLQT